MFDAVLFPDESILFQSSVYERGYRSSRMVKSIGLCAFFSLFPAQFAMMIAAIVTDGAMGFSFWLMAYGVCLALGCILSIILAGKSARNSAFCITDDRIILRSGTLTITVMDFHAGKQAKACTIAHLNDVFAPTASCAA